MRKWKLSSGPKIPFEGNVAVAFAFVRCKHAERERTQLSEEYPQLWASPLTIELNQHVRICKLSHQPTAWSTHIKKQNSLYLLWHYIRIKRQIFNSHLAHRFTKVFELIYHMWMNNFPDTLGAYQNWSNIPGFITIITDPFNCKYYEQQQ